MPHYRVLLKGENFWLEFEKRRERVGFFTTRFLEAAARSSAERMALAIIQAESRLTPLNDPADPPRIVADEIEEVSQANIPAVVPGFAFFADEESAIHGRILRIADQGSVEARTDNDLLIVFRVGPGHELALNDLLEFGELTLDADVAIENRTRGTSFVAFIAARDVHDLRVVPSHASNRTPSQARLRGT
jgi:hypothetical protein